MFVFTLAPNFKFRIAGICVCFIKYTTNNIETYSCVSSVQHFMRDVQELLRFILLEHSNTTN